MNEKETLIQARENLKASMKVVRRDLNIYNKAVLDRNKAILKNVGNSVINLFHKFTDKANINRLERKKERLAREQASIEEQIKEASIRMQKREEEEKRKTEEKEYKQQLKEENKKERVLNFKNGIKQKASSIKSKFGNIKNSILKNLSWNMINARLRAAFDSVQLFGIKAADGIIRGANTVKDSVSDFTSEQIAKYSLRKKAREEKREERKRERENANDIQNDIALNVQKIMEENSKDKEKLSKEKINLNPKQKQKVKSSNSRLGRVRNSVLSSLRLTNIDAKLRNAFENIQLFGINVANKTMKGINNIKDGVSNFTSEQIARYSEWRINRLGEKEYKARRQAEEDRVMAEYREKLKEEEKERAQRTNDHKIGMIEALNAKEREEFDIKHQEFLKQRQELIQSLVAEKNKLIGKQVKVEDYIDEESKYKSR